MQGPHAWAFDTGHRLSGNYTTSRASLGHADLIIPSTESRRAPALAAARRSALPDFPPDEFVKSAPDVVPDLPELTHNPLVAARRLGRVGKPDV